MSLASLLDNRVVDSPGGITQNVCLDAGYAGRADVVQEHGMIAHIRPRGEEKSFIERDPSFQARRWVVESSHSWFNRFRKLIPRYEKTDASHFALLSLATAMITLNKFMVIYG
jgi:transposase